MNTVLEWRSYRYFDYERDFARREVLGLLNQEPEVHDDGLVLSGDAPLADLERLTYFGRIRVAERSELVPLQARLERSASNGSARQATRYSAHGLHEYKGKFNPQVVRAIGNMLGLEGGAAVLDPFCGSGTTLLESAHVGWDCLGTDRNPLAALIANAKVRALRLAHGPLADYAEALDRILSPWRSGLSHREPVPAGQLRQMLGPDWLDELPGAGYLNEWFPPSVLAQCVVLFRSLDEVFSERPDDRRVFEVVLSDQLRSASWQEPADLRIRRRKEPGENYPLIGMFLDALERVVPRVVAARRELGEVRGNQRAVLADIRATSPLEAGGLAREFDAVITSPPYATALPYIDTQRLSLVLLGLVHPGDIRGTEAALVGARDIATSERRQLENDLVRVGSKILPKTVTDLCGDLLAAAGLPGNGFRRQNKPALIYRYFRDMAECLTNIRAALSPGAPAALVVGTNRTTLAGREFVIDTPELLGDVAVHVGFTLEALVPMNTYPRYDLHQKNSINEETLVLLRA